MPVTPLHFGINGTIALLAGKRVDFWSCIIANILVDIQPFLALVAGVNIPVHGISHTFFGGFIIIVVFFVPYGLICNRIRKSPIYLWSYPLGGALGMILHILFDSIIYPDVQPLYPFTNIDFVVDSLHPFITPVLIGGYVLLLSIYALRRICNLRKRKFLFRHTGA